MTHIHLPNSIPKQAVLGVRVSTTSYDEVAAACRRWVEERRSWIGSGTGKAAAPPGRMICVTPVYSILMGLKNRAFGRILNAADVTTPDGMPVVWALRSFGAREQKRVYGPDLMLTLCEQAARCGHRIFLYGGREETIPALRSRLLERFPDLLIAGAYSPPFRPLTPEENARAIEMIRESDADIVFVGIGAPKQELWMAENRSELPGVTTVGVGAAFDFHAGAVRQAPEWMRNAGLEWLFRLLMDPERLWMRYLVVSPVFLPLWALQKLGVLRRVFDPPIEADLGVRWENGRGVP